MTVRKIIRLILSLCYVLALLLLSYSPVLSVATAGVETEDLSAQASPGFALFPSPIPPEVEFAQGSFPKDSRELKLQLQEGESALLDQFTQLEKADLSGSAKPEEIAAWAAAHPQVEVIYTVSFPDGQVMDNRAASLDLSKTDAGHTAEAVRLAGLLPELKEVELGTIGAGVFSIEDVDALHASLPDAVLNYKLLLLGQEPDAETETLDLSGATEEDVAIALHVLPDLPNIKTLLLGAEGGPVTWETIAKLNEICPEATFDYGFTCWGVPANLADTALNFSHIRMDDEGEAVRGILPYMHNCLSVDMDSCGVSHESMAAIRDAFPQMNIVWRVNFGTGYSVRTDVEKILASSPMRGGRLNSENVQVLRYCTKVKYLDLGHNVDIADISFVSYMPDLEVFIIAINAVSDISPLANCPHLEYLEINSTNVTDLSPLVNCQELVHLNIGRNINQDEDRPVVTDLTPLFSLPKLERVWLGSITAQHIPQEQIDQLRQQINLNIPDLSSPDTPRVLKYGPVYGVNTTASQPSEGEWKIVGYTDLSLSLYAETGWLQDVLHPRYQLLREQFGYDNVPACYSLAVNDPLY